MQESLLNARIALGLSKAAAIVGRPQALYRPLSANTPVQGIPDTMLYCAFDIRPDFRLLATAQPSHSYAVLLADLTAVRQNDYLVGDDTYFICRIESLRPPLCVLCDAVINLLTTGTSLSAGSTTYGGRTAATDVIIATGWPVSMTARARGEADVTKLPSDVRAAYYDVLMPVIPQISLTFGMRIQDANGQNYEIISAELSPFGWKLLAGLITT